MIRITFAPDEAELAEVISDDLASDFDAGKNLLIVLLSRAALDDAYVQAELERALQQNERILPVLLDDAALPDKLRQLPALDFRQGYDRERLLAQLRNSAANGANIRRANRRALMILGGLATLIFAWAVLAISGGTIAFPVAEYNEEATLQAEWISGLVDETLAAAQPRSTEDARNFAATFAAAPTRLHFYIRGTATALAGAG